MDDIQKHIREAMESEKGFVEAIVMFARFNRLYYEECIKRGFTPNQALELTKAHGFNMLGGGGKQ